MKLYTAQMSMGKTIPKKFNIPVLDVTVKSGDRLFAPSWKFLMEYKSSDKGEIAQKNYTEAFIMHMRQSFRINPNHWRGALAQDVLCILCYCPAGAFCHRLLLVDLFEKQCRHWGIPFAYGGEITKETKAL